MIGRSIEEIISFRALILFESGKCPFGIRNGVTEEV